MIASHICFGGYGFWLPNDPRGSGSAKVRNPLLRPFGPPTFVEDRRESRAGLPNDWHWQAEAKATLAHPPAAFDERQREAIGVGLGIAVKEGGYVIHACSILTDHAHLVVAACRRAPKIIERHMKAKATNQVRNAGLWPVDRPVWQLNGWIRYIDEVDDLRNTIQYVFENPEKAGLSPQSWPFVIPFE